MTSASDHPAPLPGAVGEVVRAVAAAIRSDPFVRLAFLAYAVAALLYVAPFLGAEERAAVMGSTASDLVFLALVLAALRRGLERVADPVERRFWADLGLGVGCWLAASALTVLEASSVLLMVEEVLYATYYVAFVLTLERQPHLRPEERPKGAFLGWPAFAVLVSGLFAYFVMIPIVVHRVEDHSALPLPYLYLTLDSFITVKLLDLCRRSELLRWRVHFSLLAVASALLAYNDLNNLLFYAADLERPWRLPQALLWNLLFVPMVLTARLRLQPFPAARASGGSRRDAFAEARESTLVVALLFPCVHFAAYTFGDFDPSSRPPRDLLMLVWLIVLGAVAQLQLRRLERRHSTLGEGTALMSAEIAWRREMTRERERLIVEIEARNAEIEARNAEMQRFNYSLSHDLKSPLITIRGFLGLLRKEVAKGDLDGLGRTLGRIRGAADHLGRLLEQVLQLSRIGRVEGPPEEVSIARLARQAASEVLRLCGTLEIEIDPGLPVISGHRVRLAELLGELLANAVKFMGSQPRPRIAVGCRRAGDETVFEVRDNGIGIEERYRDRVFGLFERLDPKGEGTGIGLARARKIVELHGGRIWIESEGPGRGSTICFTLAPSAADVPKARPEATD